MRTAAGQLVWAFSLFCAMGRMASAEGPATYEAVTDRPTVEVIFDGPLTSPALEALALEEARIIWAEYGVDISTHRSRDCGPSNAITITVTFDAADRRTTVGSLGSIRFVNGVPDPAIVLYPRTSAALVSATPARRFFVDAPGVLRDLILGRVLGRALAHEIGHFLLRSQQHSAVGLMRALQPTADLIEPNRRPFRLSASDVRRLVAMTSSLPQRARVLSCSG